MFARILAFVAGLAGATGLSQYPAFTQQYIQRLGGQVDALTLIVEEFDRSAAASGLTRDAALDTMQGADFLVARRGDMERAFARQERLMKSLALLRLATPVERIMMPQRLADSETFAATWRDFQPAMPMTGAGAIATGIGFVGGFGGVSLFLALLLWPFRRRGAGRQMAKGPEPGMD